MEGGALRSEDEAYTEMCTDEEDEEDEDEEEEQSAM